MNALKKQTLGIIALFVYFSYIAFAQTAIVSILPAFQHIEIDSTAVVRIHVESIQGVHGYSVQISYDPLVLRWRSVTQLSFLSGALFFSTIDSMSGSVKIDAAILGDNSQSGSGDLAELRLSGITSGRDSLNFTTADFRDPANQAIAITSQGAVIQVGKPNGIRAGFDMPGAQTLLQNYPNPFNGETTISFLLRAQSDVLLDVLDITGQRIAILASSNMQAGLHTIHWGGENARGQWVSSGLYFVRLQGNGVTSFLKLLLMK
jgi:hypothetical protein